MLVFFTLLLSTCDYSTQNPGQQLSEDSECDCDWRYFQHYVGRGCRPVYKEKPDDGKFECTCPWRFDCSQTDEVNADEKVCVYKNQVYPVRSKIPTADPCQDCECRESYGTQDATIFCGLTAYDCFGSPPQQGCHKVYTEKDCCATAVECPAKEKENSKVPTCKYNGRIFYEGQRIYPDEDPCLRCLCNSNWTGINSTSCYRYECMLDRNSYYFEQGCIFIYHENMCCPVSYKCSDDYLDFKENKGVNVVTEDNKDEMCHFKDRYYPIGQDFVITHPVCALCTCKTPPDFTCKEVSCPGPPNGDYNNCRLVSNPNVCCPGYECGEKKESQDKLLCPAQSCEENCLFTGMDEDGCLLCECPEENPETEDNLPCQVESCSEHCIMTLDSDRCPICKCLTRNRESLRKLLCTGQLCGENCLITGRDEDGCPLCECSEENPVICFYNGKWYEENEKIPTPDYKCLHCHCHLGFTEPDDSTCEVIDCPWDYYVRKFPGCQPIYTDEECCPTGWKCNDLANLPSKCETCDKDCFYTGEFQDGCPVCKCPEENRGNICDPFLCVLRESKIKCDEKLIPEGFLDTAEELQNKCSNFITFGTCILEVYESCGYSDNSMRKVFGFAKSLCDEGNAIYTEFTSGKSQEDLLRLMYIDEEK